MEERTLKVKDEHYEFTLTTGKEIELTDKELEDIVKLLGISANVKIGSFETSLTENHMWK